MKNTALNMIDMMISMDMINMIMKLLIRIHIVIIETMVSMEVAIVKTPPPAGAKRMRSIVSALP